MNLSNKNLLYCFLACLLLQLLSVVFFPFANLFFFAPFLIIAYYKKPLHICVWYAFICGLTVDAITSGNRFGLYALDYASVSLLLYNQRRNFFADSLSTLPIMTFFFSSLTTLLHFLLTYTSDNQIQMNINGFFTDILAYPLLDSMYALFLFILPFKLFGKKERSGKDYFSIREL